MTYHTEIRNCRVCDICGGELSYQGTLGRLSWFRCRYCGMEQNVPFDQLVEEMDEADVFGLLDS